MKNQLLLFISIVVGIKEIETWLSKLNREQIYFTSKFNIIFTPSHNTNMGFVQLVNEVIFNGTATIIRLNLKEDWDENFLIKYSYLSKFGDDLSLHFVDDAILSGKTYFRTKRIACSINSKFTFSNVFVLLSRLSQIAFDDFLSNTPAKSKPILRSYLELPLPLIRSLAGECPLCAQKDLANSLSRFPMLDRSKAEFLRESKSLDHSLAEETHEYSSSKYFLRFKVINEIYWKLSRAGSIEEMDRVIRDYLGYGEDIDRNDIFSCKTNILKGLFGLNLINNKEIKQILLKVIIKESIEVLSCKEAIINPDIAHFNWIRTLLISSVTLDSTFFLRKNVILKMWELYDNFSDKYLKVFETIRGKEVGDFTLLISLKREIKDTGDQIKAGSLFEYRKINLDKLTEKYTYNYDRIRKNFNDADIRNIISAVEKILNELDRPVVSDIQKLVHNFFSFATFYAMNIKKSIYNDDSKSIWMEYLLRRGKELPINENIDFKDVSNIPYNNLYKFKDKLKNDHAKKTYSTFLVASFIDNTGLIYNAFNSLSKEDINKKIYSSIRRNNDLSKFDEDTFSLFNKTLHSNYYYSNILDFIKGLTRSHNFKKIFLLYKIYLFLSMIDVDLNKNKSPLCDNPFRLGIKEEMRIIIKTLSVYFNAESACIAVNPYHDHAGNRDVEPTNPTYKDKSYVVAAYNDSDLENSIPVAMDGRDEPFEFLNRMSSQDGRAYSRENWFTFFTLEPKQVHSWEEKRGQLYLVIRFFAPEAKTSNESLINSPVILGAACFVFRERGNLEEQKVFLKELVRLMLLVKGSLQNYLQKKFLNDNFRRWINKAERLQSYELRINKYQHGAAKHLADLKEAAKLTGDINVITYAWIVSAEIFQGKRMKI